MRNAIFVGKQSSVDYVYSNQTVQQLFQEIYFPYGKRTFEQEELSEYKFSDIQIMFSTWGMCEMSESEIAECFPNLECIFYAAGSVQRFARPFLNCGVKVFSAWAANGVPVAEYTLAQIILASKGYFSYLHLPGSGGTMSREIQQKEQLFFPGNYDITVGIIGAGMIGKLVIERIQKILEHIQILVYDPFMPQQNADELGVKLCNLETVFIHSDVISNHLANNAKTAGLLNGKLFDLMKPNAVFINTGRGAQVVEADLVKALRDVPGRTAVLDVTWPEPPAAGSDLYNLKNVFLTPHIAGSFGNEVHRMGEYMLEEYRRYANGLPVRYEVTMKMLETMA